MMKAYKTWMVTALLAFNWGCATTPPPEPEQAPPPVVEPVAEVPAPVSAPEPVGPPKPAKAAKTKKRKNEVAPMAAASGAVVTKPPATVQQGDTEFTEARKPDPQIKGPSWLARCAHKRLEGGVILCDADSLITRPSASVKIFTRDPALAGKIGDGGEITLRVGLPLRYRFFVVP